MIIQLIGKLKYPITLDPSVWIFDDRKIPLAKAFDKSEQTKEEKDDIKETALGWDRGIYQQKLDPPINKSISAFDKKKVLEESYVIPALPFLHNAEISNEASSVIVTTSTGNVEINLEQLRNSLFQFAIDGKQIKENGPAYLLFGDGSNADKPLMGVTKIELI